MILQSRRPSGELLDLISAQVPISTLAPYETRAPVTGSRFFGREYEISRIIGNPDTNHAILGIRRIGKTSLLREVERILKEDQDPAHVVYLECSDLLSTDDYIREVVRKLNPRELPRLHLQKYVFFFPDFLERMSRAHKSKIIFLLDEVDNLVHHAARRLGAVPHAARLGQQGRLPVHHRRLSRGDARAVPARFALLQLCPGDPAERVHPAAGPRPDRHPHGEPARAHQATRTRWWAASMKRRPAIPT